MTEADLLKAGYALIKDPANWTTGALGRTSAGHSVSYPLSIASSFCGVGAIERVALGNEQTPYPLPLLAGSYVAARARLHKAAKQLGYPSAVALNDTSNHAMVMAMYHMAIEEAERDAAARDVAASREAVLA